MATNFQQDLQRAVAAAGAPGAAAFVSGGRNTQFTGFTGNAQTTPSRDPVKADTIYDLASLTKVVATTTAFMLLHEAGKVDLDDRVSTVIPIAGMERFTFRHLLNHTTGLPAFLPLYKDVTSLDEAIARIARMDLSFTPGTRRRYSDFGFMTLGKAVEMLTGKRLDAYCHERIFAPLGMISTTFNPPAEWRGRCAATERCAWRGKVMRGAVHDENAYAVGGVSGHAGLFSSPFDLGIFCHSLLTGSLVSEATLAEMTRMGQVPSYPWQGLGWKMDPWMGGSEGYLPARQAFGHTGWTGTCLWADRETGNYAVLLSNTCHPDRNKRNNRTLRSTFFKPVAKELYPGKINVHTGLDRLLWDDFDGVLGKRLGVLTNDAAVDSIGRPVLDVLGLHSEIILSRIFTPEHGLRGQAEAGEFVASQGGRTPIVSLYGDRKRPTREELAGLELFIVDLPDVGARYYTYIHTMKECMAACAEAGVPMLILDRPNPLGGTVLEGPVADQHGSIVCTAPIPARHGMTLGETALYFQQQFFGGTRLQVTVSTCDNWPRERWFGDASLPFVPPSPNIPDAETALFYAGMCLFEGTNMNEGRGTDTPFKLCGAPWLDAQAVEHALRPEDHPGMLLTIADYTPRSIPGKASSPKHQDVACEGFRLLLTDVYAARPFTLAVALLNAIQERHPKDFEFTSFFDTLAGGPRLRTLIESNIGTREIMAQFDAELRAFDAKRPKRYQTAAGLFG